MGVFGMLAIALALYCVRNIVTGEWSSDKLLKISFWGLNIGLLGMILGTLTPVGMLLLWLRIIPDMIFINLGVVPLLLGLWKAFRNPRPLTPIEEPVCAEMRHIAPPLVETNINACAAFSPCSDASPPPF